MQIQDVRCIFGHCSWYRVQGVLSCCRTLSSYRVKCRKKLHIICVMLVRYKLLDNVVLVEEVLVLSLTCLYVNLY